MIKKLKVYDAHTVKIMDAGVIEARIDLGFGIQANKVIELEDINSLELSKEVNARAKHCTIIMLGGKNFQLVCDTEQRGRIRGKVFTQCEHAPPEHKAILRDGRSYIDVNSMLKKLIIDGPDTQVIKDILNNKNK